MPPLWVFLVAILFLLVDGKNPEKPEIPPEVTIAQGTVRGSWESATRGRYYASFKGIPYAKPPVGKNRFRNPQPTPKWEGVYDASYSRNVCIQYDPFFERVTGEEDCLHLNVYTPHPKDCANMTVLVFIHGGGFLYGTAVTHGPQNFMDRNMVVVTMNYRLGPFGFLSTGDATIPGNFGLKDQAVALQWVHDNIKHFGGSPASITLMGHSAGAASTHFHIYSDWSRGLFHRAIMHSGSGFAPWAYQQRPAQKARILANFVQCNMNFGKDLLECLQNTPPDILVLAQLQLKPRGSPIPDLFTPFVPTAESPQVKRPFLKEYPFTTAQTDAEFGVPILVFVTAGDGMYLGGAFLSDTARKDVIERSYYYFASHLFLYNDTLISGDPLSVAYKIRKKYFGNDIQFDSESFISALGDRLFYADAARLAQMHALRSGHHAYLAMYDFSDQSVSMSAIFSSSSSRLGVCYGDDVFNLFRVNEISFNSTLDRQMVNALLDVILNFAVFNQPRIQKGKWAPVKACTCPEIQYLEILSPTDMKMLSSDDFGNRLFWNSLGFNENENFKIFNLKKFRDEF